MNAHVEIVPDQLGTPVAVTDAFAPQHDELVALLRTLTPEQWRRPTACDGWDVADLVAHIVGDVAGRLSGARDQGFRLAAGDGESLPAFIDRINGEWVQGARRLSPQVLIHLLELLGPQHDQLWRRADPDASSLGVSWAGVDPAPVWFDAARELTEHWVHAMQVREAVGVDGDALPGRAVILEVFALGLPYALTRAVSVDPPAVVAVRAPDVDLTVTLERRGDGRWFVVTADERADVRAVLDVPSDVLWRRWTRQPGSESHPAMVTALALHAPGTWQHAVLDHVAIVHRDADAP